MRFVLGLAFVLAIGGSAVAQTVIDRDAYGRTLGKTVYDGNKATEYDALGRTKGHEVVNGNTVQKYDAIGRSTGSAVINRPPYRSPRR